MNESIKGKKILLIGGCGFIGHNLALKLASHGAQVDIVDSLQVNSLLNFAASHSKDVNSKIYQHFIMERLRLLDEADIPVHILDARDYHALSRAFASVDPDVVVQLAAVAHAGRSNKDPYSTFDHSLRTLENALDCARDRERHFVYFSSSMVYGNFEGGKVNEETVCEPLGIYGALKFAGEKMVIAYNQVFNMPYTIIRPSALYGERCVSRRVGQIFIENAIQGMDISISGDGADCLDFTYIGDLVHGVERVIASEKSRNQIFNLTYGESRSIAQLAEILLEHFPETKIKYLPKDKLMPERGTLDVTKAKKLIGYGPQYPLEKGYVEYIRWYKDHWHALSRTASRQPVQLG